MTASLLPSSRHLELCAAAIETQYDLARLEIFRPFGIFDRYQGIEPKDFGLTGPDTQRLLDRRAERVDLPTGDLIDRLALVVEVIDKVTAITDEGAKADIYRNIATCNGRSIERYSVRITLWWQNRQLTREYVLPELASQPKKG